MAVDQARRFITYLKKATGGQVSEQDIAPAGRPAEGPTWLKYAAVVTGIFAAFAAFLLARSNHLATDAVYQSNQAVLFQAQASDAWAEYQADSVKARIVETELAFHPDTPPAVIRDQTATRDDFRSRQPPLRRRAEQLQDQRDGALRLSNRSVGDRGALTTAGVLVQAGIALASVAALTRRREALLAGGLCGVLAVGLALPALLHALR